MFLLATSYLTLIDVSTVSEGMSLGHGKNVTVSEGSHAENAKLGLRTVKDIIKIILGNKMCV